MTNDRLLERMDDTRYVYLPRFLCGACVRMAMDTRGAGAGCGDGGRRPDLTPELGLKPRQRFLYLFDYGDQLEHEIDVLDVIAPAPEGRFPRIAETHGEAPPQ